MDRIRVISSLFFLIFAFAAHGAPITPAQNSDAQLVLAATAGTPEEVMKLIKQGASPNATNSEGTPALALAAKRTDMFGQRVMQALLDGGANINAVDASGQSALFYAARTGNELSAKFLIEHGASYYLTDKSGNVARTIAYNSGHEKLGKMMDDLITKETEARMAAYAARNQQITEQQQKQHDEEVAAEEAAQAAAAQKTAEEAKAKAAAEAAAKAAAVAAKPPPPLDRDKLRTMIRKLSMQTCEAAYWIFLRGVQQEVPMTSDQLDAKIDSLEDAREKTAGEMKSEFRAGENYIRNIETPSRDRIVEKLSIYPTNAHRKDAGIGTEQDAETRCREISEQWELGDTAPAPIRHAPVHRPAGIITR